MNESMNESGRNGVSLPFLVSRTNHSPKGPIPRIIYIRPIFFFTIYFLIEISIYNEYQFIRIFILVLIFI